MSRIAAQTLDEALAIARRLRAPWRQRFAMQWINYRWHGAPEPSIPDAMRSSDARRFVERLGGWRAQLVRFGYPRSLP